MFDQNTLNKLKAGFKKGKLKGLSGINPQRLSLSFEGPINNGQMEIYVARIKLDQKQRYSFGFGKVPNRDYDIMFTTSINPQGYKLSDVNKRLKSVKVQATFSKGRLLLMVRLKNSKNFFDCINDLVSAVRFVV